MYNHRLIRSEFIIISFDSLRGLFVFFFFNENYIDELIRFLTNEPPILCEARDISAHVLNYKNTLNFNIIKKKFRTFTRFPTDFIV